ncbi:alpha/beta fold hydrolase [Streptomyces sp. NPDC048751]|uniref:alpha/beta hydrolase n=1 Tax=Streptomyces sp. NPDC048751 TaxID=3365591 RepID=UPI003712D917
MTPVRIHVIFVHGLFSSAKAWKSFTELLALDEELRDHINVRCFPYKSPRIRLRPDRRIADLDDIAERLGTWLQTHCTDGAPVVLVTHSQGGLVVQRLLARRLWHGRGRELAPLRHIVMYACPNSGSGFFLYLRKALKFWNHSQERALRPLSDRAVLESLRTVQEKVVRAEKISDTERPIPISAYGGETDNVVPAVTATTPFTGNGVGGGVIEGDHFSIVRPKDKNAESYSVLRTVLLDLAAESPAGTEPDPDPDPEPDRDTEDPDLDAESAPHADPPADDQAPFSIALPLVDGKLYGEERRHITASVVSSDSGVHVLAGPGGSGKSRLALEIATQAAQRERRVWWIRVNQLSACMRALARELDIPDSQADVAWKRRNQADLVWRFLNDSPEPWLIVFDNADQPRRLGPSGGAVKDGTGWLRLPQSKNGLVVVTSRVHNPEIWGTTWTKVHEVPCLDEGDGATLLIECAGPEAGTREQARHLSRQLGGLPLALRTAAKYIQSVRENKVPIGAGDIRDFESYGKAWTKRFGSPAGLKDGGTSLGLDKIADAVCGISLRLLERSLPHAGHLLKAFACLNIAPIPYRRLLSGSAVTRSALWSEFTVDQRNEAITGLQDLGLIEPDRLSPDFISLHPVVHAILRDDPDVHRRSADYYDLAVRMLLDAVRDQDPDYPEAWPVWATVTPHAIEVTRSVLRVDGPVGNRSMLDSTLELARLTSRFLLVSGHLEVARDLLFPIIDSCRSFQCDVNDREILGLRHEKGRIFLESGELPAAEAELREVATRRRDIFGDLHHDTLASLHKLARAILEQPRRAREAEDILRKVVREERSVRGEEHADTMVVRHTLGRALLAQGRAAEAEAHMRAILAIRLRNWAPGTPETLHARDTLARTLLLQEKVEEAVAVIDAARRDALQPEDSHPVMRLRYCAAEALLLQGRVEDADIALSSLLADQRRVLGDSHPEARLTQDLLAKTQDLLGRTDEAP